MDKIEVTQNARQAAFDAYLTCYEIVPNDLWLQALLDGKHDSDEMAQAFARFERDILATRTDATPVAWMPIGSAPKDGRRFIAGRFNGEKSNHDGLVQVDRWHDRSRGDSYNGLGKFNGQFWPATHWQPLPTAPDATYTHPPATDVAALVEADRNTDMRGYVVGNGDRTKWRKWLNGDCIWTDDPRDATRFFFRSDANAVHHEDEDAWCIVELRQALAPFTKG